MSGNIHRSGGGGPRSTVSHDGLGLLHTSNDSAQVWALVSTIIQELEAARSRYTDVVVALFYRNPSTPTKSNDDILAVLKRLTLIHDASTENDEILRLTTAALAFERDVYRDRLAEIQAIGMYRMMMMVMTGDKRQWSGKLDPILPELKNPED